MCILMITVFWPWSLVCFRRGLSRSLLCDTMEPVSVSLSKLSRPLAALPLQTKEAESERYKETEWSSSGQLSSFNSHIKSDVYISVSCYNHNNIKLFGSASLRSPGFSCWLTYFSVSVSLRSCDFYTVCINWRWTVRLFWHIQTIAIKKLT